MLIAPTGLTKGLVQIIIAGSVLLAGISNADTLSRSHNHLYVATFNVYILGKVADKYKTIEHWDEPVDDSLPERIVNLAAIIATGGFHLVAIQEVHSGPSGYYAIRDLTRALQEIHGMHYHFFVSENIGLGLVPEAIAFIYRPHAVKYRRIDGKRSVNIEIPGRDLVKTQWIAKKFDFTLISAHLAWTNRTHRDKGYEKIKHIFDNVDSYSDDPDIIILGDFNRFGANYSSVKKLTYDPSKFLAPNVTFFDPEFSEKKSVSRSSIRDKGVPGNNPQWLSTTVAANKNVYDMILVSRDVAEELPSGENQATYGVDFGIIHFDEPGGFGHIDGVEELSHLQTKEAYSDHRPLWMRFKTKAGQYDSSWDN